MADLLVCHLGRVPYEEGLEIQERLRGIVWEKEAGHRIGQPDFVQPERTMSCIGG